MLTGKYSTCKNRTAKSHDCSNREAWRSMELKFRIPRQQSRSSRARSFASTENTPCEYANPWRVGARGYSRCCPSFVCSGCGCLEHGHDARVIQIARRDAFEMRADAAQFRSHEAVHKMQTPVEPGKQFVLDLVVNRQRDLRAVCPNLSEINDAHEGNIPTHRLE